MNATSIKARHPAFVRATVSAVICGLLYTPVLGSMTSTVAAAQAVQNTTSRFEYDANGNLTKVTDPLNRETELHYDALNRLDRYRQPAPQPGTGRPAIGYSYDGRDNVATVTDPRALTTAYTVDGMGQARRLVSPDTGVTSNTYDAAGNLKTRTDARGKVTTYTYDALNRVTAIGFGGGTGTTFAYGAPGATGEAGRVTRMTDESGSTSYAYTAFGELARKTQTVVAAGRQLGFTVAYAYGTSGSANGKPVSMTYPSGNRVNYDYDDAGRLKRIWLNPVNGNGSGTNAAVNIDLLKDIGYLPLGPAKAWSWGNSSEARPNGYARGFDLDGRVTGYSIGNVLAGGIMRTVEYDDANRIKAYRHAGASPAGAVDQSFEYDDLDRLTGFAALATSQAYRYDANGNRTHTTFGTTTYTHMIDAASNRLLGTSGGRGSTTHQYDAAGNLVSDGAGAGYTYSDRGRMASATVARVTTIQLFNGLGQRVYRAGNAGSAGSFVYDEQGHLIGEYDTITGKVMREMVYLGDLPVSVLTPPAAQSRTVGTSGQDVATNVAYIYPDHLGTPRLIARASDNAVVWRWESSDPFGLTPANDNPSGLGTFTFNLRMPGQYYDRDTHLFYNYYRDYDPQTGRYMQSDPIGLEGGINTYGYVGGNPLSYVDPDGLQVAVPTNPGSAVLAIGALWWQQRQAADRYRANEQAVYLALKNDVYEQQQKDIDNKNYHNTCDKPPPPNLSPCELARWHYRQGMSCQEKRQEWEERWGTSQSKAPHERALANVKNRLKNAADDIARYCTCP